MSITPGCVLSFLGRNGAYCMVGAVMTGLLFPELAKPLKPALPVAMGIATLGAFLSASFSVERSWLQSYVVIVAIWAALAPAIMVGLGSGYLGLEAGLLTGLMLVVLAPPANSVPAFAAMLKLSPKLAMAAFVATTFAAPFTMPAIAKVFGIVLDFDPIFYALKLFAIVGGGWLGALVLSRFLARLEWLIPEQAAATGIAVIGLFMLFATSAAAARAQWNIEGANFLRLMEVAVALNVVLFFIGSVLFARLGYKDALTVGLLTGNRNVGLTWAAAGTGIPAKTEAYLAASLVIIALMPVTFQQTARLIDRVRRRGPRKTINIVWSVLDRRDVVQSRALECGGTYVVGRGIDCDIHLTDPTVSRLHAELAIDAKGSVTIRDLGSTNGVVFNGIRVPQGPLGTGDTVQIGLYLLGIARIKPLQITLEWFETDQPASAQTAVLDAGASYTIGRNTGSDITMPSPAISGAHARLDISPTGAVLVTDLDSKNGLFFGGRRVEEVQLFAGDELQIGPYQLRMTPRTADKTHT